MTHGVRPRRTAHRRSGRAREALGRANEGDAAAVADAATPMAAEAAVMLTRTADGRRVASGARNRCRLGTGRGTAVQRQWRGGQDVSGRPWVPRAACLLASAAAARPLHDGVGDTGHAMRVGGRRRGHEGWHVVCNSLFTATPAVPARGLLSATSSGVMVSVPRLCPGAEAGSHALAWPTSTVRATVGGVQNPNGL